ncbi:MAG: transposase domain-containing protein [Paracoccaceae bacterium]
MNAVEIEEAISALAELPFDGDEFPFAFLLAFGNKATTIKMLRKNALFAGHDEGGRTWGRIASLIETCKLNGVEPYAYLKATLEAIAAGHPASRIDELMPWNFDKKA